MGLEDWVVLAFSFAFMVVLITTIKTRVKKRDDDDFPGGAV